jgi:urease accessory protein
VSAPDVRLLRLLQLASPALPVGAYSYSQGLEAAIEAGLVRDAATAGRWIRDVLVHGVARLELPVLGRLITAWRKGDVAAAADLNALFLASREAAELRAETVQTGYSLRRLLAEVGESEAAFDAMDEVAFPTAFGFAAARWDLAPDAALAAYAWAWAENQVMAAVKAVPLGQTDGQRLLLGLAAPIAEAVLAASSTGEWPGNYTPALAILSSRHETQYSRLFRS